MSPDKAAPIADAASVDPRAETRLLELAKDASLGELRDECARTKAAAEPDPEARHRAIHASRHLRKCRTADGAGELRYRSTLEEVAEIFSVVQGHANAAFAAARAEGRREPEEAYLADGLLAAARAGKKTGDTPGGQETNTPRRRRANPTKVVVRIDWDALVRGWPVETEVCEIAGLGPVPVSAVRAMIDSGDAFLAAVVTKGVDVATVAHVRRRPTAHQVTALDWRDPTCAAAGCNNVRRLENDHQRDWAHTKVTLVEWLDRLCDHHHDLKTYDGWALVAGRGKRAFVAPDDARHPRHERPPSARPRK